MMTMVINVSDYDAALEKDLSSKIEALRGALNYFEAKHQLSQARKKLQQADYQTLFAADVVNGEVTGALINAQTKETVAEFGHQTGVDPNPSYVPIPEDHSHFGFQVRAYEDLIQQLNNSQPAEQTVTDKIEQIRHNTKHLRRAFQVGEDMIDYLKQVEVERAYLLQLLDGVSADYKSIYAENQRLTELVSRLHEAQKDVAKNEEPSKPGLDPRFQPDVLVTHSGDSFQLRVLSAPALENNEWRVWVEPIEGRRSDFIRVNYLQILPFEQQPEIVQLRWAVQSAREALTTLSDGVTFRDLVNRALAELGQVAV